MTTLREAAQQALEAMLNFPDDISDDMFESITALKAALAEPPPHQYPLQSDRMTIDPVTGDVGIGSPFRCTACGGALPTTGRNDATGECVCGDDGSNGE